jgi:hypothetical protein
MLLLAWARRSRGGRCWPIQRGACGLGLGQCVELMQLRLQELLVGQSGLILGNEGGRDGPAQGVLDHLMVLGGAEQHANGRPFMGLADVAVEGLQVLCRAADYAGHSGDDPFLSPTLRIAHSFLVVKNSA